MLTYPGRITLPASTLDFLTERLQARRKRLGTWRKLPARDQALLVLAHLRNAADTRLVITLGDPQAGNRNDTIVYQTSGIKDRFAGRPVMADGGHQGYLDVISPYRKPSTGSLCRSGGRTSTEWHRKVRARVEHTLAGMKTWKILRDYRRQARALGATAAGIAHLYNISRAG